MCVCVLQCVSHWGSYSHQNDAAVCLCEHVFVYFSVLASGYLQNDAAVCLCEHVLCTSVC